MNSRTLELLRPIARALGIGVEEKPALERLERLPEPVRRELASLYRKEPQRTRDGTLEPMDNPARITVSQGLWLYDLAVEQKLQKTLEIGLAYGFSTLYFLALLARHPGGHHTAIDPYANQHWRGIGLAKAAPTIAALGLDPAERFEFLEARSDHAAIDLARRGRRFDLIYIDGGHRFDDVLVDFYLCDPLCAPGGYIVLDDMWLRSVRTVAAFVSSNRPDYTRQPHAHLNLGVFRKTGPDTRDFDHFRRFDVAGRTRSDLARELLKRL